MDRERKARLAALCAGLDRDAARRVIDVMARPQLRRVARRPTTAAGEVLRSLKLRFRTIFPEELGLAEPNTETERALAMAMRDLGLSYRHREIVSGHVADFWVSGNRGFAMAVLVTGKGRAGADAMRKRGVLTFALSDRALAEGPMKCAMAVADILNGSK